MTERVIRESVILIPDFSEFPVTNHEECGIMIGKEDALQIIKVPNRAKNKKEDFAITNDDLQYVMNLIEGTAYHVVGFMHTHRAIDDVNPSDNDFEGAKLHPEMKHLVYKPSTGEFVWYQEASHLIEGSIDS